jgi:hypothetical protein
MERLRTSRRRMAIYISVSVALTIFLFFSYLAILCTEATTRMVLSWVLGSVVALLLGHMWTVTVLNLIRNYIYGQTLRRQEQIAPIYIDSLALPGWTVGTIERVFFGALVAFDISATAAGMVTWILVKMATDWHRILGAGQQNAGPADPMYGPRSLAFGSLLGSMISLFFALIGGMVCRG